MKTEVDITVWEKKRKMKVNRTFEAIGNGFCIISIMFILWIILSWIDVVSHNLHPNAVENMLSWNFFVACFNRNQINYEVIFKVTITVFIGIQLIMRDSRLKRMCSTQLIILMVILLVMQGSSIAWIMIACGAVAVVREICIINRKN